MRARYLEYETSRKMENKKYVTKLQAYSEDVERFKQQYSERVVSGGRAAAGDSGDTRPVRSELPDEASVEHSPDSEREESKDELDVKAAPPVQADFPGRS